MGVLGTIAPKMVLNAKLDRNFHGPKFSRNMVRAPHPMHEPKLTKTNLRAYMLNNDIGELCQQYETSYSWHTSPIRPLLGPMKNGKVDTTHT